MSTAKDLVIDLHRSVGLIDRMADQCLRKNINITFSQYLVMMALLHHPSASQQKTAEILEITQAAVSRQIDLLEEKKLLVREENPDNRREHVLKLTPEGEKKVEQAGSMLNSEFQPVMDMWTPKDRQQMQQMVQWLSEKVDEAEQQGHKTKVLDC